MSTFVLVHGAWQTASTWDLVTPILRGAGHAVFVPLLSGLENSSLGLSPAIKLTTHIRDVIGILSQQNLRDVTLVGHSYAGMVITGVAEHELHRIAGLVYVDAFVPRDGQSALDLLPEWVVQRFRQQAEESGGGWLLRAGEAQLDMWGLKPGPAREFVRSRLSDFSLRCFDEPIKLPTDAATRLHRTFIASVAEGYPARPIFKSFGDAAKGAGWSYHELSTGHDSHVEQPEAFVSILTNGINRS